MGKNKLSKFADMKEYPHVFECPLFYKGQQVDMSTGRPPFAMRGQWREEFFHNDHPLVVELGCGRGEYTVGLAERHPDSNFIGIDIKGARMWSGATEALNKGLTNVAFLRTSIEGIDQFFGTSEVNEIWITFPDPQMKKHTKRLTSTPFLKRYSHILVPGGVIHLKTDSPFLYTYTDALLRENSLPIEVNTTDLYGAIGQQVNELISEEAAAIQTYYESQWLARGMTIKYIRFRLPEVPELVEPNIDIPLDDYRSYGRTKRSSIDVRPAAK